MKIKYTLLNSLTALTNKEVDILLYVAHYQDDYGNIRGIYYRDVCKACGLCKQSFYDALRSLQTKGIITYVRNHNDYDITILNNDFSYDGAYSDGYVNVSRQVFDTGNFADLRAKEKVLMILLMKVTHENGKSYQIGREKFYEKYMSLLGVTKRILRGYLHSMRSFFSVGFKDGKYYITYLASVFRDRRIESEIDQFTGHNVKVECRRNKIKEIVDTVVKDTIQLVKQYRSAAKNQGQDILNVLAECIRSSVYGLSNSKRNLNSKYVHKLIRNRLGLDIVDG